MIISTLFDVVERSLTRSSQRLTSLHGGEPINIMPRIPYIGRIHHANKHRNATDLDIIRKLHRRCNLWDMVLFQQESKYASRIPEIRDSKPCYVYSFRYAASILSAGCPGVLPICVSIFMRNFPAALQVIRILGWAGGFTLYLGVVYACMCGTGVDAC